MALFFFSSRRRHTMSLCDWSSDVCSSDLPGSDREVHRLARSGPGPGSEDTAGADGLRARYGRDRKSGVGKECRSRGSAEHTKKQKKRRGEATRRSRPKRTSTETPD